jgi:3-dehydroquinate synthetase
MEQGARTTWTDERLDDLLENVRTGFTRVDTDLRDQRAETRAEFAALRAEMRDEFQTLRIALLSIGGGVIVALIGVIGAIIARGA